MRNDTWPVTPPLPLLITGVAGVAGYNALRAFRARYGDAVIGIRRRDNHRLDLPGVVACNADDTRGLESLFAKHRFAAVLHGEGTCKLKACEMDPPMAWRINVLGAQNIVRLSREFGARLVALSIDLVFSGAGTGDYTERSPTDPVTVYGKTMTQLERVILDEAPEACVLRISLPMGPSYNAHAGAIDWIQSRFRQDKPATLYYDEIRTPTYCDCLNRVFHRLLTQPLAGLYHAGGPRKLSLFQIAQIVNRVGGYDPNLLIGCPRQDAGPMPPRAGDVTMDSSRLREALGPDLFLPWPDADVWAPTDRHWHFERAESGSPELLRRLLYLAPNERLAEDRRGSQA